MEKFLYFINHYNAQIIEVLVGIVMGLGLIIGYRSLFVKFEESNGAASAGSLKELEEMLQKALANQKPSGGDGSLIQSVTGGSDFSEEVRMLREQLQAKEAQLNELKQNANSDGAAPAAAGDNKEAEALKGKLSELEAKLSEYEIIADDIADLSRYRDENDALKAELESLKAQLAAGGSATSSAPVTAAPVVESTPSAPATSVPAEPANSGPQSQDDIDAILAAAAISGDDENMQNSGYRSQSPSVGVLADYEPAAAPKAPAEPVDAPASSEKSESDLIDDELMREFQAAVEGQKAAKDVKDIDENQKLLSEFENFLTKKDEKS